MIVLSRKEGGFHDLDVSEAQQERERKANQLRLVALSQSSEQRVVASGDDMQLEAPDAVVHAIHDVVKAAGNNSPGRLKPR